MFQTNTGLIILTKYNYGSSHRPVVPFPQPDKAEYMSHQPSFHTQKGDVKSGPRPATHNCLPGLSRAGTRHRCLHLFAFAGGAYDTSPGFPNTEKWSVSDRKGLFFLVRARGKLHASTCLELQAPGFQRVQQRADLTLNSVNL